VTGFENSRIDWLCTGEGLTRHPETMQGRDRSALKAHHYAKYCARFYCQIIRKVTKNRIGPSLTITRHNPHSGRLCRSIDIRKWLYMSYLHHEYRLVYGRKTEKPHIGHLPGVDPAVQLVWFSRAEPSSLGDGDKFQRSK
jgi:hypothetical protein